MNISLSPDLEKYIHNKIDSGLFSSASEVIQESLRLMHTYDDVQSQRIKQLNQAIDIGLDDLAAGKTISGTESYQRLKQKILK